MMHETDNDDIDSSLLYLVSVSRTEIITVPADPVPPTMNERRIEVFLMERLLAAYSPMDTVNAKQYVNWMERIGGASGSDTDTDTDTAAVRYIDDTVQMQNSDTELASQTLQTQDSGVVQAQDTQDTQDN